MKDIESFVFGGVSSRFWMLRKHFTLMTEKELKEAPFYCWQCITLNTRHREVNFAISSDDDMNKFLLVLIYKLRTVDGTRGTAEPFLRELNKASFVNYRKTHGKAASKEVESKLIRMNEHKLFRKVYIKFLVLKVRSKIGYQALVSKKLIEELFISQILSSYLVFRSEGIIPKDNPQEEKRKKKCFENLLKESSYQSLFLWLFKFNSITNEYLTHDTINFNLFGRPSKVMAIKN